MRFTTLLSGSMALLAVQTVATLIPQSSGNLDAKQKHAAKYFGVSGKEVTEKDMKKDLGPAGNYFSRKLRNLDQSMGFYDPLRGGKPDPVRFQRFVKSEATKHAFEDLGISSHDLDGPDAFEHVQKRWKHALKQWGHMPVDAKVAWYHATTDRAEVRQREQDDD